jgi:omega-6 fatty acid desaturase (delta-12 desaturase)
LGFILFHNQHTFNPPYIVNNESWNMKNSGLLGSSFIQIPIFLKYFSGGIEYHHIHHINAKIPGYNLQKYHEEVVSTSNLFDNIVKLSMVDCYNNLKLRLFSEKKNRYIRLDEVENNQLLTNILEENKNK